MIDRRALLAGAAASGLLSTARVDARDGVVAAARDAWLYTLPLVEMAGARANLIRTLGSNRFFHVRALADPSRRQITAPNVDTLYSSAWFDLSAGPVSLTVPNPGRRYLSVQLMDMFTNTNASVSLRTFGDRFGPDGATFTLVGPGQSPDGPNPIRMATPHGWALTRILTDGPADNPAAQAIQDRLVLSGPQNRSDEAFAGRAADPLAYFESAARLLMSNPPPARDRGLLARFAAFGLRAGAPFDPERVDPAMRARIAAGVAEARRLLVEGGDDSATVGGWRYPRPNLGDFGDDYRYRAIVALVGLAANTPDEALYLHPRGEDGRYFTGDGLYRLRLPAPPPVDAFWSLTMYEATPEGQLFLTPNVLSRYAIGDRTPGLVRNPDGGIDIWIGRSDPGGARTANWLPAPARGRFTLSFRAYWPKPAFARGDYRLPAIEPA